MKYLQIASIRKTAFTASFMAACLNIHTMPAMQAQDSAAAATEDTAIQNSTLTNDALFHNLRTLWEQCNNLRSTSQDLLNEGRNAPARKKWADYYLSTIQADTTELKNIAAAFVFPADLASAASVPWQEAQATIKELDSVIANLNTDIQNLKSPTDDKYPATFWKPAERIADAASKLDKSILAIYGIIEANTKQNQDKLTTNNPAPQNKNNDADTKSGASQAPLQGSAVAMASSAGFKSVGEASTKISKACYGIFGELERWNLLYGKPPENGIGDMFYGGGLTKQEIYSEYKYLPQFVFTNPSYVMRFSYRLPPRQNMLAYYTTQVGKLLNLMETELNEIKTVADQEEIIAGPWEETKKLFLDSRQQYLTLLNLVNNTSDARLRKNIREDQTTFGQPVMAIYSDMSKMRDSLNDINKMLQ